MSEHPDETQPQPSRPSPRPPRSGRTIRSEELLQGAREIFIEHEGEIYRLRLTQNGKLILQK